MWLWNIWASVKASAPVVTQKHCLSVCNHGTEAMMAVTALLGKMSASSRRLDSVLDASRLKHTVIHANPRWVIVRMVEMVPAVLRESWHPDICWNKISTSKDTEAPATTSLRQDIACCVRIRYLGVDILGQWLCDFWVNFRRVTAAKQQWLHVGPDQVLNCNSKLLPEIQH